MDRSRNPQAIYYRSIVHCNMKRPSQHRARCRCFSSWSARCRNVIRELARQALAGLKAYECAPRDAAPTAKPQIARISGTCLRNHGGEGPPAVLDSVAHQSTATSSISIATCRWPKRWPAWAAKSCCSTGAPREPARARCRAAMSSNCWCRCCAALASRSHWSAIASAGQWRSRPRTSPMRTRRHARRTVEFFALSASIAHGARRHVAPFEAGGASAGSAADGSPAGGLLVARPGANGPQVRRVSAGSIRRARKRGVSSRSKIGRTRARPCPIRRHAN